MPIYEYQCQKCKAHTEILQKITDKPLTKCRKCGGRLEKQWSSTSFQLKGSGWYATDYAAKKQDTVEDKKGAAAETTTTTAPINDKSTDKTADKSTQKEKSSTKKSDTTKTT